MDSLRGMLVVQYDFNLSLEAVIMMTVYFNNK